MHKQNRKLNLFIQKLASPPIIITSLLGFVIIMLLVNTMFKQNFSYLTQTFSYTPEQAYQLLNEIGQGGRTNHLIVFVPDILMVLLYSALLIGANYAISNKLYKNCNAISVITFSPLILSVTQVTEIIILTIILLQYPNQLISLVQLTNVVTMTKIILTVLFFITPLLGLLMLGINRFIRRVC